MTRPLAVVDIDGVLADVDHRLHHLRGRPKNWAGFFAGMGDDPPYAEGLALAGELAAEYTVVYLSGRPERTRAVTQAWLATHEAPHGRVMLRPDDDRRPARLFKIGVLKRLAAQRPVALLVDDPRCATRRRQPVSTSGRSTGAARPRCCTPRRSATAVREQWDRSPGHAAHPIRVAHRWESTPMALNIALFLVSLYALYYVIRIGVRDGIKDARKDRDRHVE